MDQLINIIRVFVASPSDVSDERDRLSDVVQEINITWGKYLNIYLELVRWETHSFPGVGDDAQDVINQEIDDKYDIFVGILWTRFGTQTKRAKSGTREEFDRAYSRYINHPSELRIMFYFSQAPTSPSDIDPAQLTLINEFRSKLGEQGVLWCSYKKRKGFETLVRIHLSRQMQEWGKSWGAMTAGITRVIEGKEHLSQRSGESIGDETEPTEPLLDLLESGRKQMKILLGALIPMSQQMSANNKNLSTWLEAVKQLDSQPVEQRGERLRQVGYRAADDMVEFITSMESQIPIFSDSYSSAVDIITRAALRLPIPEGGDRSRVDEVLQLLTRATDLLTKLGEVFINTRNPVNNWYPITPAFTFIKTYMVNLLDRLSEEMRNAANLTSEAERHLRESARG